jgi:hypothetical protein
MSHSSFWRHSLDWIDSNCNRASEFANRAGSWRVVWLILFALLYYSSYGLSGLHLRGEGGTIAVIAQRMLEGQRPLADTFLGYNLFWFYPIVALFAITGPNFLVVRIFFYVLSTITGILGYRVVWRVTGRPLLSLLAALIVILIPGMQFRTYMGLLGVGNLLFLLEVFVLENSKRSRLIWSIGAGLFLGLTFLVRIDLGILFSVLTIGAILFYPLIDLKSWRQRIRFSAFAFVLYLLLIVIVHVPVDQYAASRGFRNEFWSQYASWKDDVIKNLNTVSSGALSALQGTSRSVAPAPTPIAKAPAEKGLQGDSDANNDRSTRPRPPVKDILFGSSSGAKHLAFLIYFPIAGSGILIFLAVLLLIKGWRRNDPQLNRDGFTILIAIGSALTLLPQYFLFRPDPPHLSEMMCVFVIAAALAYGIAWKRRNEGSPLIGFIGTFYMVIAPLHMAFYIEYGIKRPSMGSLAVKSRSEVLVRGDNGVSAYVSNDKAAEYKALYKIIVEHSSPNDYVVCFPYQPMINFMTNRRSYLFNLYVDNATEPVNFKEQTIADLEKYKPAAILIDDVAMNQTPGSRFSVWAAPVYEYIRKNYDYAGNEVGNEIYLRRGNR